MRMGSFFRHDGVIPPVGSLLHDAIMALGPWAYWMLDEVNSGIPNALDESGNGRYLVPAGIDAGTMRLKPPLLADGGYSALFSVYSNMADSFNDFVDDSAVSFFALINPVAISGSTGAGAGVFHIGDTATAGGEGILLFVSQLGAVAVILYDGALKTFTSGNAEIVNGSTYSVGFTHDPIANLVKVYLNGGLLVSTAHSTGFNSAASPTVSLGRYNAVGGGYDYEGYLDHPAVFDSVLTELDYADLAIKAGTDVAPSNLHWNRSVTSPQIGLFQGETRAAKAGPTNYTSTIGNIGKSSGKWHFRVQAFGGSGGSELLIGISPDDSILPLLVSDYIGHFLHQYGYDSIDRSVYSNDASIGSTGGLTLASGDYMRVFCDFGAGEIYFGRNDFTPAGPFSIFTGPTYYPAGTVSLKLVDVLVLDSDTDSPFSIANSYSRWL